MKTSTFKRLMHYMKGTKTSYAIGLIGLSLLTFLLQAVLALLFLNLFDTLAAGTFQELLDNILFYTIAGLIVVAIMPLFNYFYQAAAVKTTGYLRKDVFAKMTRLPLTYFKQHHSAETTALATHDILEAERTYSVYLVNILSRVVTGVGALVVMFLIEWRLALLPLSAGLLTLVVNHVLAGRLRHVSRRLQAQFARVNTRLANLLAGVHVIRIFNLHRIILDKFQKTNDETLKIANTRIDKLATITMLNQFIATLSFAGIALFGSYLALEGLVTIGVIVAIVQLNNGITDLVQYLGNFVANMQTSLAAGERLFTLLDEAEEPEFIPYVTPVGQSDLAVQLNQLTFSYDQKQRVLDHLSLSVLKGQKVALVGPSGGGKSTVFKVLLLFYPPEAGQLSVNLTPSVQATMQSVRAHYAYVPQDATLFHTTIRENIAYGQLDATDEAIIEAAKKAHAHTFIRQLESGYDTVVGERGATLSGGQRQRIAIARAILKDAPILLLDEATSALDNESETLIQKALETLMQGKTTLVIAHRLSTIEDADEILVIEQGKIVESGTHDALLAKANGLYAKLHLKDSTEPL